MARVELPREHIFQLWAVLRLGYQDAEKLDKRFVFARNRTIENLTPEVTEIINARRSGIPEYEQFQQERTQILEKYCARNDDGTPVVENEQYAFSDDGVRSAAEAEVATLSDKYKETLEARTKEIDVYNQIISESVEVDITKVTFDAFPKEISSDDLELLRVMAKETDEQIAEML